MNLQKIKEYAFKCHTDTNHLYDKQPYKVHLNHVKIYAEKFSYLIPEPDLDIIYASCFCHDLIEDTRQTYNDVKKIAGHYVAEIVYALTNEKGKTRADRANQTYYSGIVAVEYAIFVKMCDRLANVEYSKFKTSSMFDIYKKENYNFCLYLRVDYETCPYNPMYKELEKLLKG